MPLDASKIATLSLISTGTLQTEMARRGIRSTWINGPTPMRPGQPRVVGPAFTMTYMPAREDLRTAAAWTSHSPIEALEEIPAGALVVAQGLGATNAGVIGDVMATRMKARGAVGFIIDAAVRDVPGIVASGLPVWCQGSAAPGFNAALTFATWQQPIACGGVTVIPGETVVMDEDGAVVIPEEYLDELVSVGPHHEHIEAWIIEQVVKGAPLPGLYPPNEETTARFDAEMKARGH